MVSDSFFVSADHSHPSTGEVVRFYYSNNPSEGYVDRVVAGGLKIGTQDSWLGYFSEPVPSSIAKYPVLGPNLIAPRIGSKILVLGKASASDNQPIDQRVGRNIITRIDHLQGDSINFRYDSVPGSSVSLGTDEANLASGDSGAPSFISLDNQLALVGTHWKGVSVEPTDSNLVKISQLLDSEISRLSGGLERAKFLSHQVTSTT